MGHFADGRGLAHAIDADDQNDAGLGGQVQAAVAHLQLFRQDIPQSALYLVRRQQTVVIGPAAQLLRGIHGHVHAHIRQDQGFLQPVVKIVVQRVEGHGRKPCVPEFFEQSLSWIICGV